MLDLPTSRVKVRCSMARSCAVDHKAHEGRLQTETARATADHVTKHRTPAPLSASSRLGLVQAQEGKWQNLVPAAIVSIQACGRSFSPMYGCS
jgi:hypothetical protein